MPKQLSADAQAYDKEYDAFLKQLDEFHQQRGTTFKRLPRINGKGIDLYLLYVVVTARGGWQKVNARNEWEDILEDFRLPAACVNSATALKHIYIRYLDSYERVNFLGEDGDERTNDGDEDEARSLRLKRCMRALNIVPLAYNYSQHNVNDAVRTGSGMCTELYRGSVYDRLALSLSSPLPNEHDFAFNMCTLLSNEGKHTLQLPQCPRLIEFMLAHTGIFRDKETQKYCVSNYKEAKGKNLLQFWMDSVGDKRVLDLLTPECYDAPPMPPRTLIRIPLRGPPKIPIREEPPPISDRGSSGDASTTSASSRSGSPRSCGEDHDQKGASEDMESSEYADSRSEDQRGRRGGKDYLEVRASPIEHNKRKELVSNDIEEALAGDSIDLRLGPEDTEIFHLGRDLGLLDSEGTRISQVLHILRNLSFEEVNIPILAQSTTCLRFLVLCICSRWGGLAVGALDTLGNIAAEVLIRNPAIDTTSSLLLNTICQGVASQDRALVLRSLEVLNRLAINDPNEEILSSFIDQTVYDQICRYLTIHDIMLLIYTLESLYSLSSMGPSSCNAIVRSKGSIQTLVSLLTVEAQSYGPEACIGMKVVETVTGVVSESESASVGVTSNSVNVSTITSGTTTTSVSIATTTSNMAQTTTSTTNISCNPSSKIIIKPEKRIVPPEVEEFVTSWVMKNYDACPQNAIEQAIVYRHFAASMHSLGRKQGLNPVLLSNCVRKVFGTGVGPSRRAVEDGTEKWHYNGIKRKDGVLVPSVVERKPIQFNNTAPQLNPTPIIPASSLPMRTIAPALTPNPTPVKVEVRPQPPPQGSILKAQLSAPLRNAPSPVRVVHQQGVVEGLLAPPTAPTEYCSVPTHHSAAHSPAPVFPRSDNSSLIKSLLANKVTTPVMMPHRNPAPPLQTEAHQPSNPSPQPSQIRLPSLFSHQQQSFVQSKVEPSTTSNQPHVLQTTAVSRGLTHPNTPRGFSTSAVVVSRGGGTCGISTGQSITPQKPPGYVQLLRSDSDASVSSDPKRVTSFEGILQNGLREDKDEVATMSPKEAPLEKRNLLADLLERTVGGDVLNGVVEKDLRITDKGVQVVSHLTFTRANGPFTTTTNGQGLEGVIGTMVQGTPLQGGVKRPATTDTHSGSVKRLAIEDPRGGPDSKITLYVSQNGNDGEVLSQGHQVVLNQGHQGQVVSTGQMATQQTVMSPQGQMIFHRPSSQGNVIVQQSPQIITAGSPNQILTQRTPHHAQVITYTSQSQGQILTTGTSAPVIAHSATGMPTQVIAGQGSSVISSGSGQVIQQVIAQGQGQKVILHGGQLGQVLGGQVILPQGGGQNIFFQGGGNLPSQVIMQGVSVTSSNQSPVIVQGTNGHNQLLVQGTGSQGQMFLQGTGAQGQLVVSGVSQGQTVVNSGGQTMIFTGGHCQPVMVSGTQAGQHMVVSGGSQGQGQMLVHAGSTVGNTVFLAPQPQGGQGPQKTLIILPNPKMVVSGNQTPVSSPMVLPRQVVQVVSSSVSGASSSVVPAPVRTIKSTTTSLSETNFSSSINSSSSNSSSSSSCSVVSSHNYTPNIVSVQVHTGGSTGSGLAPPPCGPTATPVSQSGPLQTSTPHIPAPQVLSSGIARRPKMSSGLQYVCEWRNCNQVFSSPGQVYHHACKVHCPPHFMELTCQWIGCDAMVRKRFSAMTHIHDRHCNEQLLQILALRRQQIATTGKTDIPVPQSPPPHPGYAPSAAFHAIKRHALEVINQRDAVEKEGPVTKSIRLTAALILRNLVIYSNSGKKLLRGYESELANVAISSMESSRTVGQILYDIHLPDHQAL